jgi:hypothetical protein
MATMMPDTNDGEEQNADLADKHDGADVEREHVQATMEYDITLTDSQLADLPDSMDAQEFAVNLAISRCRNELDLTFSISKRDAIASEDNRHIREDTRKFNVFVKVSQNA